MEAPHLSELSEKYGGQGLIVLAANAWDEDKAKVAEFVEKRGLKQRVLLNGNSVAGDYEVKGLPTVLWINGEGVIVDAQMGFDDAGSLNQKTIRLMKGGG